MLLFKYRISIILIVIVLLITVVFAIRRGDSSAMSRALPETGVAPARSVDLSEAQRRFGELPLYFTGRRGESTGERVYHNEGGRYGLTLSGKGALLRLLSVEASNRTSDKEAGVRIVSDQVLLTMANGTMAPAPEGEDELGGKANFLLGTDPEGWETNVPTFAKVRYPNVYPGIDAIFHGRRGELEYDFVVAPGADPKRIVLNFEGARGLSIGKRGDLKLKLANGTIVQRPPVAYQTIDGMERAVPVRFVKRGKNRVAFRIGRYDRREALTIDPILIFSSYWGGSITDTPGAVRTDAEGNVYFVGSTVSTNFPTVNALQPTIGGQFFFDAFITKFNPSANAVIFSTYLGGSSDDFATSLAIDADGSAFVGGRTASADFPTQFARQPVFGGTLDGFIAKLLPSGSALAYSTFLGGIATDEILGLDLDSGGKPVVAGRTDSPDFPTAQPLQPAIAGRSFFRSTNSGNNWTPSLLNPQVMNISSFTLNPGTPQVVYAGTNRGVFRSTDGGATWSPSGAADLQFSVSNVAVAPSNPNIVYAVQLGAVFRSTNGGDNWTNISSTVPVPFNTVAIDPTNSNRVIAGGFSGSVYSTVDGGGSWNSLPITGISNPVTSVAIDPVNPQNVFAGTSLRVYKSTVGGGSWATAMNGILPTPNFFGLMFDTTTNTLYAATSSGLYKTTDLAATWTVVNVANLNSVRAVAKDPLNSSVLYAATATSFVFRSTDGGVNWTQLSDGLTGNTLLSVAATSNGVVAGGNSGTDAFVARHSANGTTLEYSTLLGGVLNDVANSVDVGGDNRIVLAGTTASANFPVANAAQPAYGALNDAFVTKLNESGNALVYSTYLGGSVSETGASVAADATGAAHVVGSTNSFNFPVLNAVQPNCASCVNVANDAYLTKFDALGSIVFSTYHGGSGTDSGLAVAIDRQNRAYVAGSTSSANFPIFDPVQSSLSGGTDGFLTLFNAAGSGLVYSTYLGGFSTDSIVSIGIAPEGNAIVAGQTNSSNFPLVSPVQPSPGGSTDTFVAKIGTAADIRAIAVAERDPVMVSNPLVINISVANIGPSATNGVNLTSQLPATVNFVSATPTQGSCSFNAPTLNCSIGALASGAQASVRLALTPTQIGTVGLTFTAEGLEADPLPGNNTANVQVSISPSPSIFGKVTIPNGQPAADVGISLTGLENRSTQTAATGIFSFNQLPINGNYNVRPSKNGFFFTPRSRTFNSLTADGTANFVMGTCSYVVTPGSAAFGAAGGSLDIFVTPNDPYCSWTAISNVPWITITSGAGGIGNGTVRISAATSSAQRSGSLTIAGQTVNVVQGGCSYSLTPFQQSFGPGGGVGSFDIITNEPFCQWTAVASAPWVTINGTGNGIGNGTVNFTVSAASAARSARITAGGRNFAIYQEFIYCPSLTFAAPFEIVASADSIDIIAADFNSDSNPDLVTVETQSSLPTYTIYNGNGDGTFARNSITTSIGPHSSLGSGDFNGDSKRDLAVLGSGRISIYNGNGLGGLTLASTFNSIGSSGAKLYVEDLNRDDNLDFLVISGASVAVYHGNGAGTFSTAFTTTATGGTIYSSGFGDINGDGVNDIVFGQVAGTDGRRLLHYFGAPNGTFSLGGNSPTGTLTPFFVTLGDLNGDGFADVVTNGFSGSQLQVLLWDRAANAFGPPARVFAEPNNAFVARIADIDNDGKADILATSNQTYPRRISVIRGNGNGTFKLPIGFASTNSVNAFVFSDLNRDGRLDLAFARKDNQMAAQLGGCSASRIALPGATRFDFNGDRRADIGVVRASSNTWYLRSGDIRRFGTEGDRYVPADYDGDGRADIAVFRPTEGRWYRLNSSDGSLMIHSWGKDGDVPVPADFDGDERADLAVFRPSEGAWYWLGSVNGQVHRRQFGLSDDVPTVADFDGDGRADVSLFRPAEGVWYRIDSYSGEVVTIAFGLPGDRAVPGDYNGDGRADLAVFRPTEGIWYIAGESSKSFSSVRFGLGSDVPVPADYDGDGRDDIAVYRNGTWYLLNGPSGETSVVRYGLPDDRPLASLFLR